MKLGDALVDAPREYYGYDKGKRYTFPTREARDAWAKKMIENVFSDVKAPVVEGVSRDEPVVVNENGGGQSRTLYRMDLVDPKAILQVAKVLKEGADKYGAENWRLIEVDDHLNHLLIHVYAYLAGDNSDEHLSHAICRGLFALGVTLQTPHDIEFAHKLNENKEETS